MIRAPARFKDPWEFSNTVPGCVFVCRESEMDKEQALGPIELHYWWARGAATYRAGFKLAHMDTIGNA